MKKKKIFKDFVNLGGFTVYEVFKNGGDIRQFDTSTLTNVNGNNARLITKLMYKKAAPCYLPVYLNASEATDSDVSTIFIDKNEAKKYAISIKLREINKLTKDINDINNDKIELED